MLLLVNKICFFDEGASRTYQVRILCNYYANTRVKLKTHKETIHDMHSSRAGPRDAETLPHKSLTGDVLLRYNLIFPCVHIYTAVCLPGACSSSNNIRLELKGKGVFQKSLPA